MGVEITPLSENAINSLCAKNMLRENMHPPRTNPQPINIEIEYSCELTPMGVPWRNPLSGVRARDGVITRPAPYPLRYMILCALWPEKRCRNPAQQRVMRSWKLVVRWGLKRDPFPIARGTSPWARVNALRSSTNLVDARMSFTEYTPPLEALVECKPWKNQNDTTCTTTP